MHSYMQTIIISLSQIASILYSLSGGSMTMPVRDLIIISRGGEGLGALPLGKWLSGMTLR